MTKPRHIHLIGICGTAMASLAGLLLAKGHRVTGSDAKAYPPMSTQLASMGVRVSEPYAEANLAPAPDLVVVGNAISRGNVELEYVLEHRLPMTSMAALLHEEFLASRKPIVVSGTHGKTTTTSMLAWIFESAGRHPSFLIGGVAENFGASFAWRESEHFLIEGDEYDTAFFDKGPKFLHYFPQSMALTSVEFDHADIYDSLATVKTAFKRLINLVPRNGRVIAWDGSENVTECVANAFCPVERYGFAGDSHWRLEGLRQLRGVSSWSVLREGRPWAEFEMPMAGEHNALNATAAAALAANEGIRTEQIARALAGFRSVKRRLEVIADVGGVTVVDDFAHHPTAIRETLRALRAAHPSSRLWAVLEPRSNTLRRSVFEQELVASLTGADRVLIAGIYQADRIPAAERLHPETVIHGLTAAGVPAELLPSADAIVARLAVEARSGDVIAILSNGGFDGIYAKLPEALRSQQ